MIDGRSSMRRKRVRKIDVGPGKPVWSFGVMTGTSMDGIDVALLKTDGETVGTFGPTFSHEIPAKKVAIIQDCIERVKTIPTWRLKQRNSWPEWLYEADFAMSEITFDYIEMMRFSQLEYAEKPLQPAWEEIRQDWSQTCSGVHGQTVTHRPEEGFTLQIGQRDWSQGVRRPFCHQSSYFSKRTTDVTGFREDDLRSGGEGAPLAPFYHFALAKHIAADAPLAFLNIGGVANVTWVDPAKALPEEPGALLAFDTGPGNALVNDWMQRHTGEAMDRDGVAAAEGRVHRDRLGSNAARAYLERVPPKSLDRNDFAAVLAAMEGLSVPDGAATLTAFTVDCLVESLKHMPSPPTRWLICGGGRRNLTMMRMLADRLDAPVEPVEAEGLDGDLLEAQAFAFLAVRVLRGLPTSAPSTTGCREPVCGGEIWYP